MKRAMFNTIFVTDIIEVNRFTFSITCTNN